MPQNPKADTPANDTAASHHEPPPLWRLPLPATISGRTEIALRERVKELNCLYGITKLAGQHHSSLDNFLQELVEFLPPSWQHADHTCAEITFEDRLYLSLNFQETPWHQSAPIFLNNKAVGKCAIYYTVEYPTAYEGPFLREERELLNAVADQIGSIAGQLSADLELEELNQQLKLERQALRESNTALKVILSRNEQQQQDIRCDIRHNVEKILLPIMDSVVIHLPASQKKYVELLKENLKEITSPFIGNLSSNFFALSPTEIIICNMVKNGMTSKEIAEIRGVSTTTIHHHREKIRRKLGIANQEVNLATFLQHNIIETE
ncbi:MAG: helix-turn-helix transcriptional regulator [Dehalogenimonas sp.]|uniref:Helix-turn-helix transcriptional regulator n=1 Tax=Candidatus Dehalogenimonas loeffleri TaxID=3127115 RepID=A0ABZ2J6J9_9CHLR|nr:helix-turn-helix transcriptional regulator [Dehalogenimonas sp.]